MDITFLVGNGFDLSLGYKTSYKDFYDYYLEQPNDSNHEKAISHLKKSIKTDIETGAKNWADFEIGLGKFTKEFQANEADEYAAAYDNAVMHLHSYLSKINKQKKNLDSINENQWDEIRKNLCCFFQEARECDRILFSKMKSEEQSRSTPAKFHFVSFNYTNILDECIDKISQKPLEIWKVNSVELKHLVDKNVFHVHDPLSDYPIVGVSKEEQILNTEFRKNEPLCTILIKPRAIDEIGVQRYNEVKDNIKKSRIICLWGLSIGASDEYWWTIINNWLKEDPNRHLFIFEYTDAPPNRINVSDLYRKRRAVANRLLCYSKFSEEDRRNLIKRIYVIFNTQKVLVFPKTTISNVLH